MRILRAARGIYDALWVKPVLRIMLERYFNYLFLTDKCNYWTLSKESIWKIFRIKNFSEDCLKLTRNEKLKKTQIVPVYNADTW